MSVLRSQTLFTSEEYLTIERDSFERNEWLDQLIYAMAGESLEHSLIITNITASLVMQLKGTPCAVFSPNMKVYSRLSTDNSSKGLFSYPDVLVVCGTPQFHDTNKDVIINPTVIVEVLSASTQLYDRNEKFLCYRQNQSLMTYILAAQTTPNIEIYERKENSHWDYFSETDMSGSISITPINCRLHLADAYDRIEFPRIHPPENPLSS